MNDFKDYDNFVGDLKRSQRPEQSDKYEIISLIFRLSLVLVFLIALLIFLFLIR